MTNQQILEDINKICKIYEAVLVKQKYVSEAETEIKAIKDKYED